MQDFSEAERDQYIVEKLYEVVGLTSSKSGLNAENLLLHNLQQPN